MTFEEIKQLHEMGFSNAEVMQLAGGIKPDSKLEENHQDSKPEENKPDSKPEENKPDFKPEENKPDSKPEENPEITELKNTVSGLQKDMKDFITAMQKNNLQSAHVNMLPDEDLEKQSVDALSEIIRPKYNENKEDSKK